MFKAAHKCGEKPLVTALPGEKLSMGLHSQSRIMYTHLKKDIFPPNRLFALILRTEFSQAFQFPLGAIEAENVCNLGSFGFLRKSKLSPPQLI